MSGPADGAGATVDRAQVFLDLRRYDDALHLLRQSIAMDPQNARAWCLLARAHLGRSDAAAALQAAETAASVSPEDEWARRLVSIAHVRLGHREEAAAAAREAVRLAPDTWQTFVQLANATARWVPWRAEARAAAERAVSLAPHEADAHVAFGVIARSEKNRAEAEAAFRRALEIDPENVSAHHNLAALNINDESAFVRIAALAKAIGGFTNAVRADPRSRQSRRSLDLTVRLFVIWIAYLFLIDALMIGWLIGDFLEISLQPLPAVLPAIPTLLTFYFFVRLPRDVRSYVRRTLYLPPLRIPVALIFITIALLIGAATVRESARDPLAIAAGSISVATLLLLSPAVEGFLKEVRGYAKQLLGSPGSWPR